MTGGRHQLGDPDEIGPARPRMGRVDTDGSQGGDQNRYFPAHVHACRILAIYFRRRLLSRISLLFSIHLNRVGRSARPLLPADARSPGKKAC